LSHDTSFLLFTLIAVAGQILLIARFKVNPILAIVLAALVRLSYCASDCAVAEFAAHGRPAKTNSACYGRLERGLYVLALS